MTTLWIFNPETDLVMGLDKGNYTPKKKIKEMRQRYAPVASLFATQGDRILLLDDPVPPLPYYLDAEVTRLADIKNLRGEELRIRPWGWNKSLRNQLLKAGIDERFLPTEEDFSFMRKFAHRNFTIDFNNEIGSDHIPSECHTLDDALNFLNQNGSGYLKTPWTSSGKGNLAAMKETEEVKDWIEARIAKAGSIMAEKIITDKEIDLATEWMCSEGKARFIGVSVFNTNPDNRYISNLSLPQDELMDICRKYDIDFWIDRQQKALDKLIAPHYDGPLGIDMMGTKNLRMIPCVEINLRYTMGMASIYFQKRFPDEREFIPSRISSYLSR